MSYSGKIEIDTKSQQRSISAFKDYWTAEWFMAFLSSAQQGGEFFSNPTHPSTENNN